MLKKSCFVLALMFCFSFFAVSTSAARTGEFEAYDVEFRAFVPDDLFEAIEIQLTNKTDNNVLKYYLYKTNGYYSNIPVYPGEYTVRVSVANSTDEDFTYIHDGELNVVASSSAISFIIIVDNVSYDDYSDLSGTVSSENAPVTDHVDDAEENNAGSEREPAKDDGDISPNSDAANIKTSGKSSGSLWVSFLFSVILIVVVGILLWIYKKS